MKEERKEKFRLPFFVLVKREIKAAWTIKKVKFKRLDFAGVFLTGCAVIGLSFVFILLLKGLLVNYIDVVFLNSSQSLAEQLKSRQFEFLSLCYTIFAVAGIFFGISRINKSLDYNSDMENLLQLPVSSQEIFVSKLVTLYVSEILFMSTLILPVNITMGIVVAQSVWFWFATVFICVLLPSVPFLIAALLSFPTNSVMNWLKSKYLLVIILFVTVVGVLFYFYSRGLVLIDNYFLSGQIKYFFNEKTTYIIINIAKFCFPLNWYSKAVLYSGTTVLVNAIYGILASIACFGLVYLFTKQLFKNRILRGAVKYNVFNKKTKLVPHSPFVSLLYKEFVGVFRTPSYAFSYFATALLLPLMVYCCIGLLTELIFRMLGMSFNFEVSLLVVTMFAVLTNTFCASNISRDGKMFLINKSLPISNRKIIAVKLTFCSVVNFASILATVIMLCSTRFINIGEFFVIFPLVLLVTTGEIFMATRQDINRPNFSFEQSKGSSSSSMSNIILVGLLVSIVLGVTAIGLKFFLVSTVTQLQVNLILVAVLYLIGIVFCAITAVCLFVGLDKKLDSIIG